MFCVVIRLDDMAILVEKSSAKEADDSICEYDDEDTSNGIFEGAFSFAGIATIEDCRSIDVSFVEYHRSSDE